MSQDKPLPGVAATRTRNRELWVGIFVIIGVASALIALFSLTDAALFRGRYVVLTEVPDAGGIRRGDPVRMRGVNIGRVTRFDIGAKGVVVSLEIEASFPIPADSRVELRSSGLIGGLVANILPGVSQTNAGWNDTLDGMSQKDMFDQAGELQVDATRALTQVRELLNDEAIDNVHASGQDLRRLLHELAETTGLQRVELEALSKSLRRSAQAVEQTVSSPLVDGSLKRMESLVTRLDDIAAVLGRSATATDSILARVDRGEGTLGRLSRDEQLYDEVAAAATSVQKAADAFAGLAADVRENPKRYVQVNVF